MNNFFNDNECQSVELREQSLFAKLPELIQYAKQECLHYQKTLAEFDASKIDSRKTLAQLPITRKSQLISLQKKNPPLAGLTAKSGAINRIFQSPGPIYDPESCQADWWRVGQAFYAAGFRAGDLVQNCLSYHLTPGGFILDSGARACGCTVIPAGPGQTEQQLDVIEDLQPQGYCGTPSFLKILIDKAAQQNRKVSFTKALVTGEALPAALRAEFDKADIRTLQAYASADVGLIGYESAADDGLIISEELIVEIVRPGTSTPVADGEVGEVVVTSFNNDYPLIRFATGDLSAVKAGSSACGRTNMRIKGWLGRADQTTKIKGMFVHPEQVEKVCQSQHDVAKARLQITQIDHKDSMHLQCELVRKLSAVESQQLITTLTETLKNVTKLTGTVELVDKGSLADDGKVIDDQRVIA